MNKISSISFVLFLSLNSVCLASAHQADLPESQASVGKASSAPQTEKEVRFDEEVQRTTPERDGALLSSEDITALIEKVKKRQGAILYSKSNLKVRASAYALENYDVPRILYSNEIKALYQGVAKIRAVDNFEASSSGKPKDVELLSKALMPSKMGEIVDLFISRGEKIQDFSYRARAINSWSNYRRIKHLFQIHASVDEEFSLVARYVGQNNTDQKVVGDLGFNATEADIRLTFNYHLYLIPKALSKMMKDQPLYEGGLFDAYLKKAKLSPLTKKDASDLFLKFIEMNPDSRFNVQLNSMITLSNKDEQNPLGNIIVNTNFYESEKEAKTRKETLRKAFIASYLDSIKPSEESIELKRASKKVRSVRKGAEGAQRSRSKSAAASPADSAPSRSDAPKEVSSLSNPKVEPQTPKKKSSRTPSKSKATPSETKDKN